VDESVQYLTIEEFEESQHQGDQIQYEIDDIRQVLEKVREAQGADRGIGSFPAT
jgi:hypothetical protein